MLSTQHPPRIRALAALGGVILFVAACSSTGASTAPSAAAVPSSAPSAAASAAGSGGAGAAIAVAMANGTVGAYLTGKDGKTLYVFTPDSANTSTCTGTCAQTWPPFTVSASDTFAPGAGVTGALTTFARPDGTMQVAINGFPLYYYSGDSKAGDTTGQGKFGKWFVASPTGAAPAASAAPSSSSGGGYGASY
jgi:predicted lipoprotein with Yx(FWY)xxD motif